MEMWKLHWLTSSTRRHFFYMIIRGAVFTCILFSAQIIISCAMKKRIRLDIVHPEKTRVEHFLNNVDEDLEQVPLDARELSDVSDIIAGFKFSVKGRSAFVIVIFATSYSHATKIEAANLPARPDIKWTINGSILFGVESVDEQVSSDLLSFFAGRE